MPPESKMLWVRRDMWLDMCAKERAFYLACKEIAELSGTCPFERYDYELACCISCDNDYEGCWKLYLLEKANG